MGLIDDLGLDDPLACVRRSTSGRLKPAAWGSPSSVEKDLGRLDELLFKLFLGFRAWVDCAEGGQWPKDFSPERCLLWCAPLSEIDMVQHLLFYTVFGCREREQRGVVPLR